METYVIGITLIILSNVLLTAFVYMLTCSKDCDIIKNKCIKCKIHKTHKNNNIIGIFLSIFGIVIGTIMII